MLKKLLKRSNKREGINPMSEYVHKDILVRIFTSIIEGKAIKLNSDDLACSEVVNTWNAMIAQLCEDRKKTILDVNAVVQMVTRMDSSRDMIKSVKNQTDTLHSMAAISEELSASIEDVAQMSQKVSENSNSTKEITENGVKNISESIEFIRKSFDDISSIDSQMQEVKEKTHTINSIVDIVKGIADQTNLLALNASIEAARAGEQGRGFAVVADEVRKLAEHTRNSVLDIQKNVLDLQNGIDLSVTKISQTSKQLDSGKKLIDNALKSINLIDSSMEKVADTIIQVAANTEEQTAVTQSFTESIVDLSNQADFIDNSCQTTGKVIYDLSKRIDAIRIEMLKNKLCMSDMDMIEIYKTDHLLWRWRIYNMLLGNEKVDIHVVGECKKCRLGTWYYGGDNDKFRSSKTFLDLEKPHIELHNVAKEAVIAFEKGDVKAAEAGLKMMDECSVKVFTLLDKIKQELNN
ncbi:MAG TPA: methyl-accepting chemotaxis protein [Clostridiaceae bacterium]